MRSLADLRSRLDALPVDRAPLRRAGLLTLLLVALLLVSRALVPAGGDRNGPPAAERFSATDPAASAETAPAPRRSGGIGLMGALGLLAVGGAGGFVLALRRAPRTAASRDAALTVLESHTVAPGQSLRLVAVRGEVMLLSLAADGARVLRSWPAAGPPSPDPLSPDVLDADAPHADGFHTDAPDMDADPFAADTLPDAPEPEVERAPEPARLFPPPAPAWPAAGAPATPFSDVLRQFQVADV